jgi:serine protease Do
MKKGKNMRKTVKPLIFIAVWLPVFMIGCATHENASPSYPKQTAVKEVVDLVCPALVRIHVVSANYVMGREKKWESAGSGTIISPEGYIVTNHHVVGKAKWIYCTLSNKKQVEAALIGTDAMSDIAVIKLKRDASGNVEEPFPYAKWGDSSKVRVGDTVLAMGSPMTLSQSVTCGIVSNAEMLMPKLLRESNLVLDGENVGSIVRWIAHDAAIYPGNSGGPLVNLKGEIIGVNEIAIGLGGAIPSNLARSVVGALINDKEVKRSWIGLVAQPLLSASGLEKGVLVGSVIDDSPAGKAGLKPGDIITSFDGYAVTVRFPEEMPQFNRMVLHTPVGKSVIIGYSSNDKHHTAILKTVARGKAQAKDREIRTWGINARDITPLTALALKRSNTDGVFVSSIRPGGPCGRAKPPLDDKDVIVGVAGKSISNLAELEKISAEITRDKILPVPTIVEFERGSQHLVTVVKVGTGGKRNVTPEVRKAWFPGNVQVLTRPLAEAMGLKGVNGGIRITRLFYPMPGKKLLHVGDIITHINDVEIGAYEPEHKGVFRTMVRQYKPGTEVSLTVLRNGKKEKMPFTLPREPKSARELKKYQDEIFEFSAREISFMDKTEKALSESQGGVLVFGVDIGGWAAVGHLAVGDIILSVDGVATRNVSALKNVIKRLDEKKPESVIFFVKRGVHTLFLELRPEWNRTAR